MLQIKNYWRHKAFTGSYRLHGVVITVLMFLISTAGARAQVLTKLQSNFNAYQEYNLQEKVYVHVNKSFYVTGEILWFKIYDVDGNTNKMLDMSKVAYVELLDNNHVSIMQTKVGLNQGKGSGSFFIPVSLTNGHYLLRAYTGWMKNFSADYFFEKQITIVNPLKNPPVQVKPVQQGFDLQFFPEGGHLVKGLKSKIAFKVTGADGKGIACKGAIINQQNDTVMRFKTFKYGLGNFVFTPLGGNNYKAVINVNNKITLKEFPEVNESGYVMIANATDDGWDINIQNSDDNEASNVFLLAHSRYSVKIAAAIRLVNGAAHFNISKNKLDDGLSYITLFDSRQRPICERLVFKRPVKTLVINANADAKTYNIRKKVSIPVLTQNQDHKTVSANLSVSVFRADTLQSEEARHIGSYLWLCAGLKGHIESPDYYLQQTDREADEALDNLLISQGWTQFDWNSVLAGKKADFKFLPEYTGHIISGHIANNVTHVPAKDIIAYLSVPGSRVQLYTAKSDSTGRLLFNTHDFYGTNEIIVQTNTLIDSAYQIDIASPFSEQHSSVAMPLFMPSRGMENVIVENSLDMQVQNIFRRSQLKQFYIPQTDSLPFYMSPDKTYLLDSYTRFTTMEEVLREYVTSIAIAKRQGKFTIRMFNGDKPLNGAPLILLDGTPIFDADKIFHEDPVKVKKLDVVSTGYIYGPAVFNGILSFSTYKGDMNGFEIDPHAIILDYEGLQLERRFYSPVYETDQQITSTIPDFRNALYWNPDVNTNQEGKCNLMFYTGDKPGKYIGVVEGSTDNGEAGSQYFTFEVKN
jgi:hypothetical protein